MAKQKSWADRTGVRLPRTAQEADAEVTRKNKESADTRARKAKEHDDLIKKVKSDTAEAKKRAVRNSLNPTEIFRALNQTR